MVEAFLFRFRALYIILLAMAVLLGCVVRGTPGRWADSSPYAGLTTGYDVSWPNCEATPPQNSTWGIVGITGGLSLRPNKCAAAETRWFKTYTLYANTGYPGPTRRVLGLHGPKQCRAHDARCLAYNYGYAEGLYAVQLAARQGLHATTWWLDVETENSWDDNAMVNRESIRGSVDAIRHETVVARVGIYSYPTQWNIITAKWRPGLPVWAATGTQAAIEARDACAGQSFTGGPLWLGQYTEGLDRNLPCPPAD